MTRTLEQQIEYERQICAKIPIEKKQKAVLFLKSIFGEETKEQIRRLIHKDGESNWIAPYHIQWGMRVRNALRTEGFGEDFFEIDNLDYIYTELIEEAVLNGPKYIEPLQQNYKHPYRNIIIR